MRDNSFQFKQFAVAHDKCAMKVNTDGVLLGAWQNVNEATRILDIGTGCGVIALMMAQKNHTANIDAIDIDFDAIEQAKENFSNSPWHNRLTAIHCAAQEFAPGKKYDLIISNPPYFIADFQNPDHKKNVARHGVTLNYEDLVKVFVRLLTVNGKALVAIPVFNFSIFESLANGQNLFVTGYTEVVATAGKPPYLALIQLEKSNQIPFKTVLQIQEANGKFTSAYKDLTKDFYLKF